MLPQIFLLANQYNKVKLQDVLLLKLVRYRPQPLGQLKTLQFYYIYPKKQRKIDKFLNTQKL